MLLPPLTAGTLTEMKMRDDRFNEPWIPFKVGKAFESIPHGCATRPITRPVAAEGFWGLAIPSGIATVLHGVGLGRGFNFALRGFHGVSESHWRKVSRSLGFSGEALSLSRVVGNVM